MAERRMFSKKVVCQPRFRKLPADTQLLYFNLGMRADDDGVVDALEVLEVTKTSIGNLELLEKSGYVKILDDDLITYIVDWRKNNQIRKDRYSPSEYQHLIKGFLPDKTAKKPDDYDDYNECPSPTPAPPPPDPPPSAPSGQPSVNQMATSGQPNGNQMATQYSIGKYSIEQYSLDQDSSCSAPVNPAAEPPVICLPTNKKGESFPVMRQDVEAWIESYPAVDVYQQLRQMRSWLDANPQKRKTMRGMKTFIVNWLSREQNRGGARSGGYQPRRVPNAPAPYREPTPEEQSQRDAALAKNQCELTRLLHASMGQDAITNYPVPAGLCGGRIGQPCCSPEIDCPMKRFYARCAMEGGGCNDRNDLFVVPDRR